MDVFHLLIYLIMGIIILLIGIHAARIYKKRRSKYNLALVVIIGILFIGGILSYFYSGKLLSNAGNTFKIISLIIIVAAMAVFLYYPQIKKFIKKKDSELNPNYKMIFKHDKVHALW
jgi:hypothetical protein